MTVSVAFAEKTIGGHPSPRPLKFEYGAAPTPACEKSSEGGRTNPEGALQGPKYTMLLEGFEATSPTSHSSRRSGKENGRLRAPARAIESLAE